ncbi:MAG: metallophosphoesterase [Candidatus Sigynarchaeota archaeon]
MEQTNASRVKYPQTPFQMFVGLMAIAAGIVFILIDGIVFWFFQADLVGSEHAVISGIAVSAGGMVIGYLLDRNERFSRKCQVKEVNLKWLVITPIVIGIAAGVFFIYVSMAGLDLFNLDLDDFNTFYPSLRALVIFTVILFITAVPCFFIYFGGKTLNAGMGGTAAAGYRSRGGMLAKSTMLTVFGLIFIIAGGFAMDFFHVNLVESQISGGNGHNDGPWLTWNADPRTSVCISWLTAARNVTVVHYGTNPAVLDRTYSDPNLVYLHKVYLHGLSPDTTYFYRIPETFETPHASTQFNFTTAPATPRPFKFAVFGDMQPTSATSDVMRTNGIIVDGILKRDVDFALQVGDIASSGSDLEDWHLSFTSLARLGAHVPIQCAIGNHDWSGMAGSRNWGDLFSYPYVGGPLSQYYSFDYLNAHFVVIDNFERLGAVTARQMKWMEDDITAAKARGQDWIFCFFHVTIMSTGTIGTDQSLQRVLAPLFDRLSVDAVFYGHDHHYEHFNYTYGWNGLVYEPTDTWTHHPVQYFCTGTGGANLEVDYGILTMGTRTSTVRWWNMTAGIYQEKSYQGRSWNSSRYLTHPGFVVNYTQYSPAGTHDGKYYYHYPPSQAYHDEATQLGYDYGEQAYHFMEISISGKTCNITAMYPNGVALAGPSNVSPQTWLLTKP